MPRARRAACREQGNRVASGASRAGRDATAGLCHAGGCATPGAAPPRTHAPRAGRGGRAGGAAAGMGGPAGAAALCRASEPGPPRQGRGSTPGQGSMPGWDAEVAGRVPDRAPPRRAGGEAAPGHHGRASAREREGAAPGQGRRRGGGERRERAHRGRGLRGGRRFDSGRRREDEVSVDFASGIDLLLTNCSSDSAAGAKGTSAQWSSGRWGQLLTGCLILLGCLL
eukprot:XP_020393656.1 uncharacterized protein LOC103628387 [Zea mays]